MLAQLTSILKNRAETPLEETPKQLKEAELIIRVKAFLSAMKLRNEDEFDFAYARELHNEVSLFCVKEYGEIISTREKITKARDVENIRFQTINILLEESKSEQSDLVLKYLANSFEELVKRIDILKEMYFSVSITEKKFLECYSRFPSSSIRLNLELSPLANLVQLFTRQIEDMDEEDKGEAEKQLYNMYARDMAIMLPLTQEFSETSLKEKIDNIDRDLASINKTDSSMSNKCRRDILSSDKGGLIALYKYLYESPRNEKDQKRIFRSCTATIYEILFPTSLDEKIQKLMTACEISLATCNQQ